MRPIRLAVLIDAENVAGKVADALFDKIAELGTASVREKGLAVYGFGKRTTLEAFRNSCSAFFATEEIKPKSPARPVPKTA